MKNDLTKPTLRDELKQFKPLDFVVFFLVVGYYAYSEGLAGMFGGIIVGVWAVAIVCFLRYIRQSISFSAIGRFILFFAILAIILCLGYFFFWPIMAITVVVILLDILDELRRR